MANNKYINYIKEIIELTKEKRIKWRYLDSNKRLYEGMEWTYTRKEGGILFEAKERVVPNFDVENSFYVLIDNFYTVILVRYNSPADLYIVPETFKNVINLTSDEYGEYTTRLLNLVQSQFPNAETFIDNFLNQKNN